MQMRADGTKVDAPMDFGLAMLAAVGWPLSELFDGPLASTLGMQSKLLPDGRAPSLGLRPQPSGGERSSKLSRLMSVFTAASVEETHVTDNELDDDAPG